MFKNFNLKDFFVLLILIFFVLIIIYFYVNKIERNNFIIKIYPIQNFIESQHIFCSEDSPDWLREIIQYTTFNHQAPNNQIVYINPRGKLFHCESGYLGFPLFSKKVNPDTRFRYASVSKLWTSDAILDLIKQNRIQFNTPILSVLPKIPEQKDSRIKKITIADLLLHRAGFNRVTFMGDEMFRSGQQPFCPNYLEKLSDVELSFDPNTTHSYSNLGYCLLGKVISQQYQKNYADIIDEKYHFKQENIKFLKNKRFPDEAKYRYIETSLTGYSNIYTAFDYPSLASSAGISGNATALAHQVKLMIQKPQPNILTQPDLSCDITKLRDCYGYAMFPYQKNKNSLKVYFRDGALLGMSSLVVVDQYGGVVTLLSSGQAKNGQKEYDITKMKIYNFLNKEYE